MSHSKHLEEQPLQPCIDLQFRKLSSNLKISNLISLDFPDGSREFVVLRGFEAEIKSFCCRKPHIEIEKSREISARSGRKRQLMTSRSQRQEAASPCVCHKKKKKKQEEKREREREETSES